MKKYLATCAACGKQEEGPSMSMMAHICKKCRSEGWVLDDSGMFHYYQFEIEADHEKKVVYAYSVG